jgi:hypothetical protein
MNGLYSLRRKYTERDPMEGPLFPNIPGPPLPVSPKAEEVSQPDNTMNTLLKLINVAQALRGQPTKTGQNVLLNRDSVNQPIKETTLEPIPVVKYGESPGVTSEDIFPKVTTPEPIELPGLSQESRSVITPEEATTNAILRATKARGEPEAKSPSNALLDYWKQPVIGKMPLDQFVQIAGALGGAFGTGSTGRQTPMGRVGNVLSQIGGAAYAERMKREYEEPTNVLRKRLLEAQVTEAEKEKIPTDWQAIYKDLEGKIDSETGEPYTAGGKVKYFNKLKETLKEVAPHYVPTIKNIDGIDMFGKYDLTSKTFNPIREATEKDIEDIRTCKIKEIGAPTLKEEFKNINGIPHKRQIQWDSAIKNWIPKGDWIRTEKPTGAEKETTPIQYYGVISKIEGAARSLANAMVPGGVGGVTFPAGGGMQVNKGFSKEDVEKWVKAYQDSYIRKVDDAKRMGALPRDYVGDLHKDEHGNIVLRDPTSSTGWRYREMSPNLPKKGKIEETKELPAGSKLIGKSKKTGNPVYMLPDGSTKEVIP